MKTNSSLFIILFTKNKNRNRKTGVISQKHLQFFCYYGYLLSHFAAIVIAFILLFYYLH